MGTRRVCGARSEDGSAIAKGTEVVVTRYEKGIAYVRLWSEMSGEDEATPALSVERQSGDHMNRDWYKPLVWLMWVALPATALNYWRAWDQLPAAHGGALRCELAAERLHLARRCR